MNSEEARDIILEGGSEEDADGDVQMSESDDTSGEQLSSDEDEETTRNDEADDDNASAVASSITTTPTSCLPLRRLKTSLSEPHRASHSRSNNVRADAMLSDILEEVKKVNSRLDAFEKENESLKEKVKALESEDCDGHKHQKVPNHTRVSQLY